MDSKKIRIYGKVQGVFFRASAKAKAKQLGIKGFVRNLNDGSVYIEARGNNLQQFIDWCRKGPPAAEVDDIDTEDLNNSDFDNFEILRS